MRIFALIAMFISINAFAYNDERCMKFVTGKGGFYRLGLSVSQFFTSTGECSFLGSTNDQKRKLFYTHNFEFIQKDASRGNGESLNALILLSGCRDNQHLELRKEIKNKFIDIFQNEIDDSYKEISYILDRHCQHQIKS